jgi:RimJ/RimL family protein N-acetyltransferase
VDISVTGRGAKLGLIEEASSAAMDRPVLRLSTARLELRALTADALDALILRDRARLAALTDAHFPRPLLPPPLTDDALPYFRDQVRAEAGALGSWLWLIIIPSTRAAVGVVGLGGKPDGAGRVVIGWSLYPAAEGHGYATEAAQALVSWALAQDGIRCIRATIPPWHRASIRVAAKLGMRRVGTAQDTEVGEVVIFER